MEVTEELGGVGLRFAKQAGGDGLVGGAAEDLGVVAVKRMEHFGKTLFEFGPVEALGQGGVDGFAEQEVKVAGLLSADFVVEVATVNKVSQGQGQFALSKLSLGEAKLLQDIRKSVTDVEA